MPELPEVETVRRQLAPLHGQTVLAVTCRDEQRYQSLHTLPGRTLDAFTRRGKYLLGTLDDSRQLLIHFGMTGQLYFDFDVNPPDHIVATITFARNTLTFRDPRRFGRIAVIQPDEHHRYPTLVRLGVDPLDPTFDRAAGADSVTGCRTPIKSLLLSQTAIAGLGNYLVDEALWQSRIHPQHTRLTSAEADRLITAIVDLIERSLAAGGMTARDYRHVDGSVGRFAEQLHCYGRRSHPCHRCHIPLTHDTIAGRGTTWCTHCQPQTRPPDE